MWPLQEPAADIFDMKDEGKPLHVLPASTPSVLVNPPPWKVPLTHPLRPRSNTIPYGKLFLPIYHFMVTY